MSQATLSDRPYSNSNLFSGHYLDERIQSRAEWDCDEDAKAAMDDLKADLIEAFVPVVIDETGGFANLRKTATKTNSLVDRLRKLTLPALEDVRGGLESYFETKSRAEELE